MHVGSVKVLTTIACCLVLAIVSRSSAAQDNKQQETAWSTNEFPAPDDLKITADLYLVSEEKQTPLIVLCHQAGWSRGEYREIAPKLNQLGFNCLAIDQRSGGKVNDVPNETVRAALAAKKATTFIDAEQDIIAAIKWVRKSRHWQSHFVGEFL